MIISAIPRPQQLPSLASQHVSLERDGAKLDTAALPKEIREGISLGVVSTGETAEGDPIVNHVAAPSRDIDPTSYLVKRDGFTVALAGAQELARSTDAVAVVQAKDGERYLVALGVWDASDESEMLFDDIGGTPYWNSAKDHVLLTDEGTVDLEAVVTSGGTEWINFTGHPVKLPKQ